MKKITQSLKIVTLALVLSFGFSYAYAWIAPTATPPSGNVSAPINTSATAQTKTGGLTVGSITAPSHCIGASCLTAWPTGGATPPVGSTFLNTSATAQTKAGGLTVDSATSTKDIVVNGITVGQGNSLTYSYSRNTVVGTNALRVDTTGFSNTAIGDVALYSNTTGSYNLANGASALQSNTTGSSNAASGVFALVSNTTGFFNTASGFSSLFNNTTGSYNTASGIIALYNNTTGSNNTATGYSSLSINTTGSHNTAYGEGSLGGNTTGSYNTAVGYNTYMSSGALTNATAIGNGATAAASNEIQLGNTTVTAVRTSGKIYAPSIQLSTGATAGKVLTSDATGNATWQTAGGGGITTITGGSCAVGQVVTSISTTGVVTCGAAPVALTKPWVCTCSNGGAIMTSSVNSTAICNNAAAGTNWRCAKVQ